MQLVFGVLVFPAACLLTPHLFPSPTLARAAADAACMGDNGLWSGGRDAVMAKAWQHIFLSRHVLTDVVCMTEMCGDCIVTES